MPSTPPPADAPWILITGAAGAIGGAVAEALAPDYRLFGLDRDCDRLDYPCAEVDLADRDSVRQAIAAVRREAGDRIAAVIHLAAYFDFSGEDDPRYHDVNVAGTRHLLEALQDFEVGQLLYASTMLVHAPVRPGERIDEHSPLGPRWAYPRSKLAAEREIAAHHGRVPYVILRLAGLYDDRSAVPTLAQQIARIHGREFTSHVHPGDPDAGQSMVHREDLVDAVVRTIERRDELPSGTTLLVGEADAPGYAVLQDTIGRLVHGEQEWPTFAVPAPLAKAGAWLQGAAEPLVPDAIDRGEKPFIRPFMVDLASDHYALDTTRARRLLGWQPRHRLQRTLPKIVAALKADPRGWYRENGVAAPHWLEAADDEGEDPERLRRAHEAAFRAEHARLRWARAAIAMLGAWLLAAPLAIPYDSRLLLASDLAAGALLVLLGLLTLSWRFAGWRLAVAAIAVWLLLAPLLAWTTSAALYANATLTGALLLGLAIAVPPWIGVSPLAARSGPVIPPGWDLSPSSWSQRIPIIALAFVGLAISRSLAAYQLGHVDGLWDPLFDAPVGPRNGSEHIVTSELSEAWPVPDAAVGAVIYLLEIVIGLTGGASRWRTMPWLVLAFAALIVPLGAVSIGFIVIQPLLLGTWCALCLLAAAAMLLQIPFAVNELLATLQFLRRRRRAGRPLLLTLLHGDTDRPGEHDPPPERDELSRPPGALLAAIAGGGVALPWNLAASIAIGVSLMLTRLSVGAQGTMADADHLLGALVITVSVIACAEVARPLRWLNALFGAALLVLPWLLEAGAGPTAHAIASGLLLLLLAPRRGPIRHRWGDGS